MLANGDDTYGLSRPAASLMLVDEINHRVINEFTEAIAMLSIAASRADRSVGATLRHVGERLRNHADAHRALCPPVSADSINLADHVSSICESFTRATLADHGIRLTLKAEDIWVSSARGWRIGLVISELIRNASRHGAKAPSNHVEVVIKRRADRILCAISNSGGLAKSGPPGRGQRLIRALVSEAGGSVRWSFALPRSLVVVRLPVTARPDAQVCRTPAIKEPKR